MCARPASLVSKTLSKTFDTRLSAMPGSRLAGIPVDRSKKTERSPMKMTVKGPALVALGASVALILSGCSGGTSATSSAPASSSGPVTMTFWHNSTTGDGKEYWEETVAEFEKANPDVTIDDPGDPERGHGRQAADRPELRRRARHLHGARRRQAGRRRGRRSGAWTSPARSTRTSRPRSATASFSPFDDRRQGLRHADLGAARRHLLQQGPVREGRHHGDPDHDRRARDGRRRS